MGLGMHERGEGLRRAQRPLAAIVEADDAVGPGEEQEGALADATTVH